ncbi:MAG: S8 family serine peptidase [Pseudomonadota bacterium]
MSKSAKENAARKTFKVEEGLPYLWPHIAVGLAEHEFVGDAWSVKPDPRWLDTGATRKSRVAIIDNGLCRSHPNLPKQATTGRIDFSHDRAGSTYPWRDKGKNRVDENEKQVASLIGRIEDETSRALIQKMVDDARALHVHEVKGVPDPCDRFSAHGTACAGLVAGRTLNGDPNANPWAIKYLGMDPFADIIPINTPYNYEYWPVTNGLIWALRQGADVILLPRGVYDLPDTTQLDAEYGTEDPDRHPRFTRLTNKDSHDYDRLAQDKEEFEQVLAIISRLIPVVVSAGNDGTDELQYPARLVKGTAPHLIVVGACTARGIKSTYSNGQRIASHDGVTVFAPSDDQGEISQSVMRYNERDWRGRQLTLDVHTEDTDDRINEYSPFGVLAIDIPGTWGYSALFDEDLEYNDEGQSADLQYTLQHSPGALYTMFGGTSAASSIVAGLLSTHQMRQNVPKTGQAMKDHLLATAHKPGVDLLDAHESEYGPTKSKVVQGLIDAKKLI